MSLDRRRFLEMSAAAAVASHLPAQSVRQAPGGLLRMPRYDQVAITSGIAKEQQGNSQAILGTFDDDALLKPFRAMAGVDAPGRDLGGWYGYLPEYNWRTGDAGFAPGHSFGQWTSVMARFAAGQGDAQARNRILHLNDLLAAAITPQFFDKTRFPAYTLDKLNCGLLDAHTLLSSPDALAIANKVRQCALPSLPPSAQDRENHSSWRKDRDASWGWDESYTLPENLYLLYEAGAGSSYAAMARAYTLDSLFEPLARDQNVLGGLHGYSHVNALCSAIQAFLAGGNRLYLQAAVNGYRMIAAQSYATGGWAPDEMFEKPGSGKFLASLTSTHNSFETPCGTYAFLKLSRYLLQLTRDGRYGDGMERILFNSMFGALPLQPDGRTFYYADLNQNARRVYSAHRWPCCAGTYPQVAADYGINTYLLDPEPSPGLWVNLYLPSTITWEAANTKCHLSQQGSYPLGEQVTLVLETDRTTAFSLHLRIPTWCARPGLRINGQPHPVRSNAGFATTSRIWKNGDRVELHLPAQLRLEPFPGDGSAESSLVAICWGPLVLMPERFSTIRRDSLSQLHRVSDTEWRTRDGHLSFHPFFAVGDAPYSTYLQIT